jgi:monomeric isocitrate dehydrogenase
VARILAEFPDDLAEEQKVPDAHHQRPANKRKGAKKL